MTKLITYDDKEVSKLTISRVLDRVFSELDRLDVSAKTTSGWYDEITAALEFSDSAEIGFAHARAVTLALVKKYWDEVDEEGYPLIPHVIKRECGFSFMNYAKAKTGAAESTIDNYIRTANIWFLGNTKPLGQIQVVKRELDGRPILQNGKPVYEYREFDPKAIDMSKLLLVNARATAGTMTEELWEKLVDPYYTCQEVHLAALTSANPAQKEEEDLSLKFYFVGPGLYARKNGREICLCEEFEWEPYYAGDELAVEAINHVMLCLRIPDDTYIIDQETRKSYEKMK